MEDGQGSGQAREDFHTWVPEQLGHSDAAPVREDFHDWVPQQLGRTSAYDGLDPEMVQAIDSTPHPSEDAGTPGAPDQIGLTPPPAPQAPGSASTRSSGSYSASYQGFGPDRGQGAVWSAGAPEFAQNEQRITDEAQRSMDEFQTGYQRNMDATDAQAKVQALQAEAQSKILEDQQNFLRESAELDKVMYAESKADADQYLHNYQQQIAAVRQMTVNAPMATLPKWQAGGVSLAMFAQGFLAAQGIHIDVGGQVDRWIDRNIEEQQRQIGQAEKGADDQLNLWRIARETSRDDLEARQRYRGMMLESMQTALDLNAARFASPLAKSAAEVAKSKVALEAVNTARTIRDNYEQQVLANRKAYRDEMHMKVMERIQSIHAGAASMQAQAAMLAATNKGKAGEETIKIQDTRNVQRDPKTGKPVSGGQVVAEFQKGTPEAVVKKVSDSQEAHDNLQSGLDRLRELYKELDTNFGPGWLRNRRSEAYTLFSAERDRIVGDIMRSMTGMAATDAERAKWENQLKDDGYLQQGPNRLPELIDGMAEWGRKKFENSLHQPGVRVLPQSERYYTEQVSVDPETSALSEARKNVRLPSTIEQIAGPAATDRERLVDRKPTKFYEQANPNNPAEGDSLGVAYGKMQSQMMEKYHGRPAWSVQLEDLARASLDPAEFAKGKTNTDPSKPFSEKPEDIGMQALDALDNIANGRPVGPGAPVAPADRQAYAKKLADMLRSDPEGLKKLLEE